MFERKTNGKDATQLIDTLSKQVQTRAGQRKAPGQHIAYSRAFTWPRFTIEDAASSVMATRMLANGQHATIWDASVATDDLQVLAGALKIPTDGLPLTPELLAAQKLIGVPGVPPVQAFAADDGDEVQAILFRRYTCSLAECLEYQRKALAANPATANPAGEFGGVKPLFPQVFYVPAIAGLVDVLMRAHSAGAYHGNLTPSSVLFGEDGGVAISDWSHAILVRGDGANVFVTGPHGDQAFKPLELRMCHRVPLHCSIDTTPLAYLAILMATGLMPALVRELMKEGRLDEVLALLPACARELVRRALSNDKNERPTLEEWRRVWPRVAGADGNVATVDFITGLLTPEEGDARGEEDVADDMLTELEREAAGARAARDGRAFKSVPGEAPDGVAQLRGTEDAAPRRANSTDGASGSLTTFPAEDLKALAAAQREAAGGAAGGADPVREVTQALDTTGAPKPRAVHIATEKSRDDLTPVGAPGAPEEVDWAAVMGRGFSRPGEPLAPAKSAVSFASVRSPRAGDANLESLVSSEFEQRLWGRRFVSSVGEARSAAGSMPGKISDGGEMQVRVSSEGGGAKGRVKAWFMKMIPFSSCIRPRTPMVYSIDKS